MRKKEMTLTVYDDKQVGIDFKYNYEKPTKGMRKKLLTFLNSELIPFSGYRYTLKEGKSFPDSFKFIEEIVKPYGTMKIYLGTLIY